MAFDALWVLLALPLAFGLGWLASRLESRQDGQEPADAPRAYFTGLNLLLNEQHDKAIDAFIEAVQHDPRTTELHFALGNLFRRRGEFERAVRVHQHLLSRADLSGDDRQRAQHALAQDYMKAGLFDRAEQAFAALAGTPFANDAKLALLAMHERSRDWRAAIATAHQLEDSGTGSFKARMAHYHCELALEAEARGDNVAADEALAAARDVAPLALRPAVMQGLRLARAGQPLQALQAWAPVTTGPGLTLIADEFASAARAAGQADVAVRLLNAAYLAQPSIDLLPALALLDDDPAANAQRMLDHLQNDPGFAVAARVLDVPATEWPTGTQARLQVAVEAAARPQRRYRCAACGFEAQQHFWQCPGCQSWDSMPARRLDDR